MYSTSSTKKWQIVTIEHSLTWSRNLFVNGGKCALNPSALYGKNKQRMVLDKYLKNTNKIRNDTHTTRSWKTHSREITLDLSPCFMNSKIRTHQTRMTEQVLLGYRQFRK